MWIFFLKKKKSAERERERGRQSIKEKEKHTEEGYYIIFYVVMLHAKTL